MHFLKTLVLAFSCAQLVKSKPLSTTDTDSPYGGDFSTTTIDDDPQKISLADPLSQIENPESSAKPDLVNAWAVAERPRYPWTGKYVAIFRDGNWLVCPYASACERASKTIAKPDTGQVCTTQGTEQQICATWQSPDTQPEYNRLCGDWISNEPLVDFHDSISDNNILWNNWRAYCPKDLTNTHCSICVDAVPSEKYCRKAVKKDGHEYENKFGQWASDGIVLAPDPRPQCGI